MKLRAYITRNLIALSTAAALFAVPFSGANAGYQESSAADKKEADKIELVEEKAPRGSKVAPESIIEPKHFMPFDESSDAKQNGFFYLIERDSKGLTLNVAPSTSNSLALDSILNTHSKNPLTPSGLVFFSAEGAIDLTVADGDSHDPALDGFALSLKSAMNLGMPELALSPESVGMENPLLERQYNLGISFGYSGFNIDANFMEKDGGVRDVYKGIDIGFSYRTQRWMTRVGLSEYTYARSPYSILPEAVRRLYSVEVGGAYSVSPWVSLTGGLKVTDFDKGYEFDKAAWNSQVYLGGRLSY